LPRSKRCLDETNSFYEINFNPPPAEQPDEFHAIQLQIRPPGLTVRTRNGYYAQP
jgi:hypothetical protein